MTKILKNALLNSIGTVIYIVLVASFMFYAEKNFPEDDGSTIFMPIAFLLLFVFSAAITGFLVFGRPAMWYLDGKKKDAIALLGYTLLILFILLVFVLAFLIFYF